MSTNVCPTCNRDVQVGSLCPNRIDPRERAKNAFSNWDDAEIAKELVPWPKASEHHESQTETLVSDAVVFLCAKISSSTHARWDQHLRNEYGDEKTDKIIAWLHERGIRPWRGVQEDI